MGTKRLCGDSISAICSRFFRLATLYRRSRHHWWTSSRVSLLSEKSALRFLTSQVSLSVSHPLNTSIPAPDGFLRIFNRASLVRIEEPGFLLERRHSPRTILLSRQELSRSHCVGTHLPLQLYRKLLGNLVDPTKTECLQQILTLSQGPLATSFLTQLYLRKRTYRRVGLQNLLPQSNYCNLMSPVRRISMTTYDAEAHWTIW